MLFSARKYTDKDFIFHHLDDMESCILVSDSIYFCQGLIRADFDRLSSEAKKKVVEFARSKAPIDPPLFYRRHARNFINYGALIETIFTGSDECDADWERLSPDDQKRIIEEIKVHLKNA